MSEPLDTNPYAVSGRRADAPAPTAIDGLAPWPTRLAWWVGVSPLASLGFLGFSFFMAFTAFTPLLDAAMSLDVDAELGGFGWLVGPFVGAAAALVYAPLGTLPCLALNALPAGLGLLLAARLPPDRRPPAFALAVLGVALFVGFALLTFYVVTLPLQARWGAAL